MNTTIFKTGNVLNDATIGVNKLVITFPGGATEVLPYFENSTQIGLLVHRKLVSEGVYYSFRVKVFNGTLLMADNIAVEESLPVSGRCEEYQDEEGNDIKLYTMLSSMGAMVDYFFHWSVGTTRIEVIDTDNIEYAGLFGKQDNRITEAHMNFNQFGVLNFARIQAFYVDNCVGDLRCLKNKTNIQAVNISGSDVTGDVKNLVNSAGALSSCSFYASKVYGDIKYVLDAKKAAGAKNTTFGPASLGLTDVLYDGDFFNMNITATYDANGDYTVEGS